MAYEGGDMLEATGGAGLPQENSGPGVGTYAELGIGLAGLGMQAYGAFKGYSAAKTYNAAQTAEIGSEQNIQAQKYQAMVLMNDRQNKENLRDVQKARSLSVAAAVGRGQGASDTTSGSGLQGSLGAESARGNVNALGLSQNLQIGQNIFAQQQQISADKITMANAQLQSQQASAWGNIGKDVLGAAGTIAKFIPLLA